MKKITWIIGDKQINFTLNRIEYWIMKNIFLNKKYKITSIKKIKGQRITTMIYEEAGNY